MFKQKTAYKKCCLKCNEIELCYVFSWRYVFLGFVYFGRIPLYFLFWIHKAEEFYICNKVRSTSVLYRKSFRNRSKIQNRTGLDDVDSIMLRAQMTYSTMRMSRDVFSYQPGDHFTITISYFIRNVKLCTRCVWTFCVVYGGGTILRQAAWVTKHGGTILNNSLC